MSSVGPSTGKESVKRKKNDASVISRLQVLIKILELLGSLSSRTKFADLSPQP